MFFLRSICDQSEVLKVIYFIQEILKIIFLIAPILLIVMVSIDFGKNVIGKESDMSKNVGMMIKRIIAAVFLFLVPTVVSLVISLVGETTTFTTCLNNANLSYIHDMDVLEEEERIRRAEEVKNKSSLTVVDLSSGSGVATTGGSGSTAVTSSGTLPSDKKYYPINGKKNGKELKNLEINGKWLSDSEMKDISSAIKSSVNSSDDWGTRVALAGWALIYYSSEKGIKIHYQLGGNGAHKGFYHDWGTKLSSDVVNSRCSSDNTVNFNNDCGNGKAKYVGLDCTQFIRWAVYNGCGISVTASCGGSKVICYTDRSKFSRTTNYDKAKPGDILIKNGHVVLFLKKLGNDYYIAEATRGKGHGTLINKYTKEGLKSNGFEVIQMTDGYKKYCKK